jgi:hypothetical protein
VRPGQAVRKKKAVRLTSQSEQELGLLGNHPERSFFC